jgi:hypothetical protein
MAATIATRKPIDQITVADLVDFPIWEFCLDEEGVEGMDETWVRPLAAAAVPNEAYSLSVAAEFETASGLRVNGLIGVTTAEGEVEIAYPVLLFDGKYLFVPSQHDMQFNGADEKLRSAIADALGTSPVFPLRYRLSVPIEGEASHREGTVA